jgi:two-component system chemotaxis response regulator CheY
MNGKKILVVDDDAVFQRAVSAMLNAQGYAVAIAADGSSAMTALRRNQPDLVLLDITFPPDVAHGGGVWRDGFTLLSWLRRTEEIGRIPVIMIGGDGSPELVQRARAAGATGFFPKPINYEALVAVIGQFLGEPVAQPHPA